jgi:hypothetical protein
VSQRAETWDKRWATSEGRADWLEPHLAVVVILPQLHARGAPRGCSISVAAFGRRLGEIWRVLRPAGLLEATVLSTGDANYGIGRAGWSERAYPRPSGLFARPGR